MYNKLRPLQNLTKATIDEAAWISHTSLLKSLSNELRQ